MKKPLFLPHLLTPQVIKAVTTAILLAAVSACSNGEDDSSPASSSNSPPVATTQASAATQDVNSQITLGATDADGDTLTYSVGTQAEHGTVAIAGAIATYTPNADFSGSDSFTFIANDGAEDSNAATVTITVAPVSVISGVISTTDGSFIEDVAISVSDAAGATLTPQVSAASGEFVVKAKTDTSLILSFVKAGFAKQTKTIKTPNAKNLEVPMNITMLEAGATQTVDNDSAAQVDGTDGASVKLAANSFIDASGNPVSGNIDVVITPVDVSDNNILAAFPGEFSGISESTNDQVAIVSGGTTYFEFSQGGEALQLADGMTAEIELPIFVTTNPVTGNPIELGDTVELWYLNESTGIWVQEGTGTVVVNTSSPTGYALNANVSHFTPWNVDWPMPDFASLDVTVNGTVNGGVATLKTRTTGTNWGWLPSASPMIIGTTQSYPIFPWSGETCVWLEYTDAAGAAATSPEQCITAIVPSSTYAMTFDVATAGSLVLHNSYSRSSYRIDRNAYIYFSPQSLESNVTYAITAGALPSGMTLSAYGNTRARITGSSSVLGSYSVTVEGTDGDGFTDSRTVSFDIVNPPVPSLYSATYIHANASDAISEDLSVWVSNNTAPSTSWTVTQNDGSAVPSGVTISSAGVLSIDSFDGSDVVYKVTTYNIYGASNEMDVHVKSVGAPILPQTQLVYTQQGQIFTEQLTVTNASAPATSWSITNLDGTPADSRVSISNGGSLTIDNSSGLIYQGLQFKVTAANAAGVSNEMTIDFFEDGIFDFCTDPAIVDPALCS